MATIIQFPNSISFLENLKAVRIASSETVAFKLSSGGSTILEETYSPGPSGIVEVELRDVISEYLAIAYPSSDVFNQASAIAQMTVNVDDDEDQDFTVLSGGVRGLSTTDESFLRANWLTWQPQTKTVRWNQPEYLTFAHLSAGTVKAKFYTKAGGSETVTLHSASAGQVNTYRMQMSTLFAASSYEPEGLYGLVDVWVENGGVQQSYVQRYVCTPETRDEHYFSCVNSLGGIDTFCFTGPQILAPSVEHAAALRGDRKIDITPAPERSWTQNTGDLDKAESKWIWDFFNSSRHWAAIDGELEEIVIESSSVRASDAENLNAFDFAFSPVNTGRTMKIDRTSGQLPAMQVLSPTGDLFFLAPRIVDYPDATIDESLLLLTQSPLVQEWQKIGIGPLCDYLSDQIHNTSWGQLAHTHSNKTVIDALSEQGGKLLFNGQPVTPDIPQMPDHYIAGTKAKTAESDDALSRVTKISFTAATAASESVDLEVVTINGQRFLHTSLPFFSDSEITAGGVGSGETPGPATTLGALLNVDSEADDTPTTDKILVREAGSTHWTITDLADISGTVVGVRMNGTVRNPGTDKIVDLGSVATLGTDGKVPSSQLPSYVDDVLEFATLADFPATGESGKIYIALDTNLTYRWGGSAYVPISQSLALGETESTAYRGDRGKAAYDHSQITSGNPHGTTFAQLGGSLSFDKLPDIYVAGTKAKSAASDDTLSRVTKISFTAAASASDSVDLEVVTIDGHRVLHTSLPFYSDSEVTAGGPGSGGGGSTSTLATLLDVKHSSGNVIQRLSGGDVQTGDLFLKGDSTHWYALAKGTNGQILKMVNGLPSWGDAPATGVTSISVNSGAAQTGAVALTIPTKTSDLTNDSGFITGITSSMVTAALGYTPYNATNPSGYITGITSSMVTTALGYTPYNATNPNGFITSSALSGYLPLSGGTLTGTLGVKNELYVNGSWDSIDRGIHLNQGGSSNYGFDIVLSGASMNLRFQRRNNTTTPTTVFTLDRGSDVVNFMALPKVNGQDLVLQSWAVSLSTTQTITGIKTFTDANNLLIQNNNTSNIVPNENSVSAYPTGYKMWHDHFAYLRVHTVVSKQVLHGSTWTSSSRDILPFFNQKENQAINIVAQDEDGFRFVLQGANIAYSQIAYLVIGRTWDSPGGPFSVTVELSTDGTNWTVAHQSTMSSSATTYFCKMTRPEAESYLRISFVKSGTGTQMLSLSSIKGLTKRKGDQGLGIENELPFDIDARGNIYPFGTQELGTASHYWNKLYSKEIVVGGNITGANTVVAKEFAQDLDQRWTDSADVQRPWYGFSPTKPNKGSFVTLSGYYGITLHTGNNNPVIIDVSKVGIGTTSPSEKLHVVGNIVATGEITAGSASDARFKSNIGPLRNALAVLNSLRPVEFDWNGYYSSRGGRSAGHDIGFVAQEVQPLIPSAVSYIFGDHLRLDYAKLTPYLVSGWQSHEKRIAALEMENAELKRQLATIRS